MRATAIDTARQVVAGYTWSGGMDFAYGQGSVFSGFETDGDLDIVIVWHDDEAFGEASGGARDEVRRLSDPGSEPTRFRGDGFALDKLLVAGWEVDVAHYPRARFDSWCAEVGQGDGWQEYAWPQPLHAVAGFVHGALLADDDEGSAGAVRQALCVPDARLAAKATAALEQQLPGYATALLDCVERNDGWLFHELATRLVKVAYVAWFAVEGHYLPFPKHLRQWVRHLGLEGERALLESRIWESAELGTRRSAVLAFAGHVLRGPLLRG